MCGIFSLLNVDYSYYNKSFIQNMFMKGKNRGPEQSITQDFLNGTMGFHRLAINGLDDISSQPIEINDIVLICNGEIFNYKELFNLIDVEPHTNSDCEIIIHLFIKYGIDYTLSLLDGEYAFILLDNRCKNSDLSNYLYIARDPFGVRPLFMLTPNNINHENQLIGFASEVKSLIDIKKYDVSTYTYEYSNDDFINKFYLKQFNPGSYNQYKIKVGNNESSYWELINQQQFYKLPLTNTNNCSDLKIMAYQEKFATIIKKAVFSRCSTSERPVACLLSGGIDSSTVAAIANHYFQLRGQKLQTFSIGLEGSVDLKYAKEVADYLDTEHHEIIINTDDLLSDIEDVIYAIESYDTTTVRASIGNYLIGKYISKITTSKVILNGDGADELFGGYLYFHNLKNNLDFDREIRHLLNNIHYFDVLRSDRCISSHGLEPRTPFLDKDLVNFYLSLPISIRNHNLSNQMEKQFFRDSVSTIFDMKNRTLLPKNIIYRKKEAFSDGVSSFQKSFFTIIQEKIEDHFRNTLDFGNKTDLKGIELEKIYYKSIFDEKFPDCSDIIPYFWMPKFASTNDPSARLLNIYNEVNADKESDNYPEMKRFTEGCVSHTN
jgi:asparagine synthase (glutamine-hydrolysing)